MSNKLDRVLEIFTQINNIPRKSKHEEAISNWLVSWAKERGFQVERDTFLDVLIKVPGTQGFSNKECVVFQGHMDMVCEKRPETVHDFLKDPIKMYQEDGWLKAKGTSLGADNGIALAMAMAIATDPDLEHPPLELLFTVDEETGLTGAVNLEPGWVSGNKLINIDSEEVGVFTIGCAGGRDAQITLPVNRVSNTLFSDSLTIDIGGLSGGHSGVEINQEKANANILIARLLNRLKKRNVEFALSEISGGSAHNAISRNSRAVILLNKEAIPTAISILSELIDLIKIEYKYNDPNIKLDITEGGKLESHIDSDRVIDLLLALPHGVANNSREMKGIVETSCNLAVIESSKSGISILMSQRSSLMSRLDEISNKIESVVLLSGGSVEFGGGYPPWQPNFGSQILMDFKASFNRVFSKDPVIEVIHAGLECGVIGSKYPGMEMISIGPTILNPHSPDEKMLLSTITEVWDLVVDYLKQGKRSEKNRN